MKNPRVSFVIAAFNSESTLARAVSSALEQIDVDIEVIIVDDASTDETQITAERLTGGNSQVSYIRLDENRGPAAARNVGINSALGEWIAVLDADDYIESDRAANLLRIAEMTESDIVSDNLRVFDESGRSGVSAYLPFGQTNYLFQVHTANYMLANAPFQSAHPNLGYLKPMIRADFIRSNKLSYNEQLRIGEDYHFCLEALLLGASFIVTSQPYYHYRISSSSISHRIKSVELVKLLEAHNGCTRKYEITDTKLLAAAGVHQSALQSAIFFQAVVEALKERKLIGAIKLALMHPSSWRLLVRFGFQSIAKRL